MEEFQSEQHDYYRRLYSAQKAVNIYFITCDDGRTNESLYVYVAVNALLHESFMEALEKSVIPDFAVVVEKGMGMPSAEVKQKMKEYYGFDHATAEANRASFKLKKTEGN